MAPIRAEIDMMERRPFSFSDGEYEALRRLSWGTTNHCFHLVLPLPNGSAIAEIWGARSLQNNMTTEIDDGGVRVDTAYRECMESKDGKAYRWRHDQTFGSSLAVTVTASCFSAPQGLLLVMKEEKDSGSSAQMMTP